MKMDIFPVIYFRKFVLLEKIAKFIHEQKLDGLQYVYTTTYSNEYICKPNLFSILTENSPLKYELPRG